MTKYHPITWLLALVTFAYPLLTLLTGKYLDGESGAESIVLRICIACIGVWIFFLSGASVSNTARRYFYFVAAFWFLYACRIWYDGVYREIPLPFSAMQYFGYLILFAIAPALGAMRRMTEEDVQAAVRLFALMASAFVVLLLFRSGELARMAFLLERNRMGSSALNPISIGHASASAVLFGLFMLTRRWARSSSAAESLFVDRLLLWVCLAGGLFGLILSASRGPLVALVVAATMMIGPLVSLRTLAGMTFGTLLVIVVFVVAARFIGEEFSFSVLTRFADVLTDPYADASSAARVDLAGGALSQFLESPVFGSALVERASNFYPHNMILEGFMSTGLMGGALLTYLSVMTVILSWRLCGGDGGLPLLGALAAQAVIGALLSGALYINSSMWYLMVLVLSTALAVEPTPRADFHRRYARTANLKRATRENQI